MCEVDGCVRLIVRGRWLYEEMIVGGKLCEADLSCSQVPSRPIQNAGSALLSSLCCVCTRFYTKPDLIDAPEQQVQQFFLYIF